MAHSGQRVVRSARALVLGSVLVASLSACSTQAERDESLAAFSAEEIFRRGEYVLENSTRAENSLRYFREIERLYPDRKSVV